MYKTLKDEYIDDQKIEDKKLLYGAAEGLAQSLNDEYTTFMPPANASSFNEEMQGEFEGIGAYVEMPQAGKLIITAPIYGSPADNA
jgi:carboxyl-terminal processing protease